MAAVRLRWIGETRRQALRAMVVARCATWLSLWSMPGEPLIAEVEAIVEDRTEARPFDPRWYALRGRDGTAYLHASSTVFETIGGRLAQTNIADGCGIALGIGRRALADLVEMLRGFSSGNDLVALAGMPATAEIGQRHGAAGFVLRIDGVGFELYFDALLCDAMAPTERPSARALETRRSAILPVDATFAVTLDLGAASIAESLALRPGEVIRTSIPVDAPIRVCGASGETLLSGTLVAENGQRAVRISHSL